MSALVRCPDCEGRRWTDEAAGRLSYLCGTCKAVGRVPNPDHDALRFEAEDLHAWREAAAFFAVCFELAEPSGNIALQDVFRSLWRRATDRADKLDEAELKREGFVGELATAPVEHP